MRCSTSSAIAGAIWNPLAPAPIIATRLPAQVDRVVPLRGVEGGPVEVGLPRDGRHVGSVELPDGADDRARRQRRRRPSVGSARRTVHVDVASSQVDFGDLGLPPHVRPDAVLVHHAFEVGLQFGLFGEEVRPLVGRLEAVAVEVISDVDPRARVGVLVPGAADARVLLDDGERNAGLLEPDGGEQSRLAAADDDDGEVVAGRRSDRDRSSGSSDRGRRVPSPRAPSARTRRARVRRRATPSSP